MKASTSLYGGKTVMTESELYEIPYGKNTYCGPAALAYLMRSDPDTAARLLREVSGTPAIKGIYAGWMVEALRKVGLNAWVWDRKESTLSEWVDRYQPKPNQEYLLSVSRSKRDGQHYIVVHGDRYFDNACLQGEPISACPYLKLNCAWKITAQVDAIGKREETLASLAIKPAPKKRGPIRKLTDADWVHLKNKGVNFNEGVWTYTPQGETYRGGNDIPITPPPEITRRRYGARSVWAARHCIVKARLHQNEIDAKAVKA
jgi:hypothetical protein